MPRILVAGAAGSGKTYLARQLAHSLGIPHVELDALHWGPDWTPCPLVLFRERIDQALQGEHWVADGDYGKVRDLTWKRADTLVWLDYPLPLILWRLLTRTLHRTVTRQELWNGNYETWYGAFLASDNLFADLIRNHARRRARYLNAQHDPGSSGPQITRLRSPREARRWLGEVSSISQTQKREP